MPIFLLLVVIFHLLLVMMPNLCLGTNKYGVTYVIHYGAYLLISNSFLKKISEIIIIDFTNYSVIIILK